MYSSMANNQRTSRSRNPASFKYFSRLDLLKVRTSCNSAWVATVVRRVNDSERSSILSFGTRHTGQGAFALTPRVRATIVLVRWNSIGKCVCLLNKIKWIDVLLLVVSWNHNNSREDLAFFPVSTSYWPSEFSMCLDRFYDLSDGRVPDLPLKVNPLYRASFQWVIVGLHIEIECEWY